MADIFLLYSSKDRARIQGLRDALVNCGFTLFWDQEIPATTDWDSWICQHLNESKCAVVVWSAIQSSLTTCATKRLSRSSRTSSFRYLLDSIAADRFPMGLYAMQAADLTSWAGDLNKTTG